MSTRSTLVCLGILFPGAVAAQWPDTICQWAALSDAGNPTATGVYGELRVPDPANRPPGRLHPATWSDGDGMLWMFGGKRDGQYLNDLWKYDTRAGVWTWMHGSSSLNQPGDYGIYRIPKPTNTPGGRFASACWIDEEGMLCLNGGYGFDGDGNEGRPVDKWEYDRTTNMWTWTSGLSTLAEEDDIIFFPPGLIQGPSVFTSSDDALWVFGSVRDSATWRFDPVLRKWKKIREDGDILGHYGTLGVPHPDNVPSWHWYSAGWMDANDVIYIFGGNVVEYDSGWPYPIGQSDWTIINDMWMFDPETEHWTWIKGSYQYERGGYYGTRGNPNSASIPGARSEPASWQDHTGTMWMFGGWGNTSLTDSGNLSDLWIYNPDTNQWTWMKGPATPDNESITAAPGVYTPDNNPSGRRGPAVWPDGEGGAWLFGGRGITPQGYDLYLADLWHLRISQPHATNTGWVAY